jgi:hypothetical protein
VRAKINRIVGNDWDRGFCLTVCEYGIALIVSLNRSRYEAKVDWPRLYAPEEES